MSTTSNRPKLTGLLAVLALVVVPLVLLWPSLFGDRVFLPFDLAQFPPRSTTLQPAELEAIREQPANLDSTEIPVLVLPEIELSQLEWAEGRFPHWNPYARFGAPLFANGLAALVYPPNWFVLFRGHAASGLALTAYLSLVLAGILAYAFLREIKLAQGAALFGALVFAFGGTIMANCHFYMRMNALIWLPGMLLACLRISHHLGHARIPATIGLALCTAMTLLAGFPPFAAASLLVTACYGGVLIFREAQQSRGRPAINLALWLAGGGVLGVALATVQLLPMLGYFPESNRGLAPTSDALASQGFDPMGLLGFVLPDAFGHPGGDPPPYNRSPLAYLLFSRHSWNDGRLFFPHNFNFTEYAVFFGTLPLLLAMAGVCCAVSRFRWPACGIGAGLLVLAVAPSLVAPLYDLPGLRNIPPMRYMGPFALVAAALAAMGFDAMLVGAGRRVWTVVPAIAVGLAAVCAVLALISPLSDTDSVVAALLARYGEGAPTLTEDGIREFLGGDNLRAASERLDRNLIRAAVALSLAGAWLWAWAWARRSGRMRLFHGMAAVTLIATVAELLGLGRPLNSGIEQSHSTDTAVHDFLRQQRIRYREQGGITVARAAQVVREPLDLPPGLLFPERVRDLNSYAFVDQFSHRAFQQMYGLDQMTRGYWPKSFPDDARLQRTFFDLIGLRFVLSSEPLERAGKRVGPELRGPGGEFFVYERPDPLPRAFVVPALRVRPDDDSVLRALVPDLGLGEAELDPRAAVLVLPDGASELGPVDAPPDARGGQRAVRFHRDQPNDVILDVAPGAPGYLVLADSYMSGWRATIDGDPVPVVRGNLFMRVVRIPARGVQVRYTYYTPGLVAGLAITAIALIVAISLILAFIGSRRRSKPSEIHG